VSEHSSSAADRAAPLRRLLELPVHPFLFGAYAVLFLWSQNVDKVRTLDVLLPLLLVLAGTALAFGVAWFAFRSARKAALVASVLSVLFFSFGHVVGSASSAQEEVVRRSSSQTLWLVVWAALAVVAVAGIALMKTDGRRFAYVLNLVIGVLVGVAVVTIGMAKLDERRTAAAVPAPKEQPQAAGDAASSPKPQVDGATKRDIYFILLDRYANQQTLLENYGHDNSYFINGLEDRGLRCVLLDYDLLRGMDDPSSRLF
jgi:hypothetical protein